MKLLKIFGGAILNSYIKDNHRFKTSQGDCDGECSYNNISKALERNKNVKPQSVATATKQVISRTNLTPMIIKKTGSTSAEVAKEISGGLSDIIKVGLGFNPK